MHKFYENTNQFQIYLSNPEILEKEKAKQLTDHMKVHVFYEKKQTAYRCYHSTETGLVKVQNDLLKAIDNGSGVFLVRLDLSVYLYLNNHIIIQM